MSWWRRLRRTADEAFCMFCGPNQCEIRVRQTLGHLSTFDYPQKATSAGPVKFDNTRVI
jgi:hypothetical protein